MTAGQAPREAGTGATPEGRAKEAAHPAADLSAVVGHHTRMYRKQAGLTLRALSDLSGLSIGFLSQLERGRTSIGLTTLHGLAEVMGRDITEFFDEAALEQASAADGGGEVAQVIDTVRRRHEKLDVTPEHYFTLTRASGEHSSRYVWGECTYRMLSKRARGLVLEPMLVEIAPGARISDLETHEGEEFAYVLKGELVYIVEGTEHRLRAGDSLHLKSSIPHNLRNESNEVTVVVSVVTPRMF